jgi:peptidoglycan/xylan/chitin deacetylase (PgdA/CDA1 family)
MPAHGLMFHHFHDDLHPKVQGSISAQNLIDMIEFVGRDNILSADEWMRRALAGTLGDDDLCLTFDDALRCQYDVALPVMRAMGITGFWFVYSSVIQGNIEPLEVFRYFRTVVYDNLDNFYQDFFTSVQEAFFSSQGDILADFDDVNYLIEYPIFSKGDRIFRWLRDDVLSIEQYNDVMQTMMNKKSFNGADVADLLWMNDHNLEILRDEGHCIGLHSYSHPTCITDCSFEEQQDEYNKNYDHLMHLLGSPPVCMSHPSNWYNDDTLSILQNLGVKIGFRADFAPVENRSLFEFRRQDSANLMREMTK